MFCSGKQSKGAGAEGMAGCSERKDTPATHFQQKTIQVYFSHRYLQVSQKHRLY